MAPGPTHVTARKFLGLCKVCRPSVQSSWEWGGIPKPTPTTSTSKSRGNTPAAQSNKKSGKTCAKCGSRKHTIESCPQISKVAKKMHAARGGGKGKRGRGRGKKRKFGDSS